jgi:hypothetical protein
MQNLYVSSGPMNLYLLLGRDPNHPSQEFVRLSGVPESEARFALKIKDKSLKVVFEMAYENLVSSSQSLLEFYPYLPDGQYVVELSLGDFVKKILWTAS